MPFLSALQRLLGYFEDDEDEAETGPAVQEAPAHGASVEPPLVEPPVPQTCSVETPLPETSEVQPPLPEEEPETPYWEDDRLLEVPSRRLPQKLPAAPSAAGPSPSTPVELSSAAADSGPTAWQPPVEFDLRECHSCKCFSYLRKQACVNSRCASYWHVFGSHSIFFLNFDFGFHDFPHAEHL